MPARLQAQRLLVLFLALFCFQFLAAQGRETLSLDPNWKFHLGNADDAKKDFGYGVGSGYSNSGNAHGPAAGDFNDANWRTLDLPHDWAIELPFVADGDGDLVAHGSYPLGRDYPDTSIGWYRRHFSIPTRDQGKRLTVTFDGIFRDAKVWVNGYYIGRHESGYTGFTVDITDFVHYGGTNTLVVRVDASHSEGWFYEGAGIYRHVWLNKTPNLHITENGVQAVSTVNLSNNQAVLKLAVTVKNHGNAPSQPFLIEANVLGPKGETYKVTSPKAVVLPANGVTSIALNPLTVPNAHLWSLEDPALYAATASISPQGSGEFLAGDSQRVRFGIRSLRYDKDQGFFLNGKHVEIQGTCNHQDHAGVGAAVPDALQYFRVNCLKAMGCNAIRTSHNAPAPALLEACDELGMLVMDENRTFLSSQETLEDLAYFVKRDRNHPSVIMWSLGNEEGSATTPIGENIALTMKRTVHLYDSTRPVSMADNHGNDFANGANTVLDLRGWNYYVLGNPDEYHKAHPNQPMYGSEEASTLSTRGIYANDPDHGYMGAYDTNKPGWGSTAEEWWAYYAKRPYLAGAFVWTGFDYRGEPTPYSWPCISSHFGILDTCGFPKDNSYYYQSQWTAKPMVHLLPDWTWPGQEGKPIDVWVYSNCSEVEVLLNGKSVGRQAVPQYGHIAFKIPYAPGTLEARGYNKTGQSVAVQTIKTAGVTAKLLVTPDRDVVNANGEDVAVFNISAFDASGNKVPSADSLLKFRLEGDAKILGVGNGDPSSHEPDTYVSTPIQTPVEGWTVIDGAKNTAWEPTLGAGHPTKVDSRGDEIASNQTGLFVGRFSLSAEELSSSYHHLLFGRIRGDATIYLNGTKIGQSSGESGLELNLSGLKVGENVISVFVRADGRLSGLGLGVNLVMGGKEPTFQRHLFNGLAQVIVKLGTKAGKVSLFAESDGLPTAMATITAAAAAPRPTAQ